MTLIVKELVVRGLVSTDHSQLNDSFRDNEKLIEYLDQMKKEIEKECLDKIVQKLENKKLR